MGDRPPFRNPRGNNPEKRYLAEALRSAWKVASKRAGFPDVGMHEGTKHSTATALRSAGVPRDSIQKACGHSDPRRTETYANLDDTAVVHALRKRDQLVHELSTGKGEVKKCR